MGRRRSGWGRRMVENHLGSLSRSKPWLVGLQWVKIKIFSVIHGLRWISISPVPTYEIQIQHRSQNFSNSLASVLFYNGTRAFAVRFWTNILLVWHRYNFFLSVHCLTPTSDWSCTVWHRHFSCLAFMVKMTNIIISHLASVHLSETKKKQHKVK